MLRTPEQYLADLQDEAERIQLEGEIDEPQDPIEADERVALFWIDQIRQGPPNAMQDRENGIIPGYVPRAYREVMLHVLGDVACHSLHAERITDEVRDADEPYAFDFRIALYSEAAKRVLASSELTTAPGLPDRRSVDARKFALLLIVEKLEYLHGVPANRPLNDQDPVAQALAKALNSEGVDRDSAEIVELFDIFNRDRQADERRIYNLEQLMRKQPPSPPATENRPEIPYRKRQPPTDGRPTSGGTDPRR